MTEVDPLTAGKVVTKHVAGSTAHRDPPILAVKLDGDRGLDVADKSSGSPPTAGTRQISLPK